MADKTPVASRLDLLLLVLSVALFAALGGTVFWMTMFGTLPFGVL